MSRTPPNVPINKFTHHKRLEECEVVASNALTAAKEALAQLKLQPPRGEKGDTGLMGLQGPTGAAGRNGKDGVSDRPGPPGVSGPMGKTGERGFRGEDGRPGRDGVDGKDSTVPGPKGEKGDAGAVLVISDSELAAELHKLRAARAAAYARVIQFQIDNNCAPRTHAQNMMRLHLAELQHLMSIGVCEEDVKKYR